MSSSAAVVMAVAVLAAAYSAVNAIICAPCYDPATGDYVGPPCPPLPQSVDASCEPAYRHCSCCQECARRLGEVCHQMTTP